MNKRILMHMCCGPCSIYPLSQLKKEFRVTGFLYNPNIHPFTEYKKRLETAEEYIKNEGISVIKFDEYDLEEFLRHTASKEIDRCSYCYIERLERTAKTAKENSFDAFTTTLLVSPYQKHEGIRIIAEEIAEKFEIDFYYQDFRVGYREGVEKSRELGMYRQKYCGCIYSEKERYVKNKR